MLFYVASVLEKIARGIREGNCIVRSVSMNNALMDVTDWSDVQRMFTPSGESTLEMTWLDQDQFRKALDNMSPHVDPAKPGGDVSVIELNSESIEPVFDKETEDYLDDHGEEGFDQEFMDDFNHGQWL